ncbi:hypothetical protein CEE44_05060 [Candidatus Woesearchaeota archaeon B3_Woes]|nr:MAG: hypothetical protein CEE44_05060 [Candidatus Woesearchaeota archaeon B3_Woes]
MKRPIKLDLGFMKIEHHIKPTQTKPKFIKIEHHKEPYKPNLESNININVLPKSMHHLIKKERIIKPKHKPTRFSKLIKEIKTLFDNIIIFNSLLMFIILFLAGFIILMILNLNKLFALVIPFIYLIITLFIKLKENQYLKVEKKFPNLNEKIRTAADNLYVENPVVDELRHEVSHDLRGVDYASFFKGKSTSYKIFFIILLCFGVIFLAKYDIDFKLNFERVFGFIEGRGEGNSTGIISDIISATTTGPDEDIFGEEYLAELGNDQITISMNKVGYEINMDDVRDPSQTEFEDSLFPPDMGLEKAQVYIQKDLEEHKELVKNYFKNMAQS